VRLVSSQIKQSTDISFWHVIHECSATALLYNKSEVEEYFFRAARMLKGAIASLIRSVASLIQVLTPLMLRQRSGSSKR